MTKTYTDREIVISRIFDAPRERVFDAWTDPEQIVKWWGPRGFTTDADNRAFEPGGVWRHTMIGPDGTAYPNLARFEEIVRPERIVYTNGGGKKGGPGVKMRTTVTFKDVGGGKTELTMHSVFESPEMRDTVVREYRAIEGGQQTLERLAEHLAGEFVLTRLVNAPRTVVFKAWTDPERLAKWFGPKGLTSTSLRMDLREGGVYHYRLQTPDGNQWWGRWVFRDIVEPEKLVFVMSFSDAECGVARHPMSATWPLETLSTILFMEMGDKTLLTIKGAPLNATEAERQTFHEGRESMRAGWGGTMEQLVAYLEEVQR